jgi:hypothetical protein
MAKKPDETLYNAALTAIHKVFSDTSMSKADCRTNLNTLIDEIDVVITSLGKRKKKDKTSGHIFVRYNRGNHHIVVALRVK